MITSCKRDNHAKGNRSPEEWGRQPLAIPYEPSPIAYLLLMGRRITADQQAFLEAFAAKKGASAPRKLS